MKIIWIYRVLADGNTHITTWRETHKHLREKHEIYYVFPYAKQKVCFSDDAVLIKKAGLPGIAFIHFFVKGFVEFIKLNRRINPDAVIFDQFTALYSLIYCGKRRRPLLFLDMRQAKYSNEGKWFAGRLLRLFTKQVLRLNAQFHDGITLISEALKKQLMRDTGFSLNSNYLVWPSGVDCDLFAPSGVAAESGKSGSLELFFHGSVTHDRGLAEALEAISLCKIRGMPIRFTIVGDGAFLADLRILVQRLGLAGDVRFLPLVPYKEVPALIDRADVCMMAYPSSEYWEGNVPIKLLEYMAMEKVVLCSELKVFRRIIGKAPCAHFIDDNSPETIAGGLEELFEIRDSLPLRGKTGRSIVIDRYSWRSISLRIDEFLSRTKKFSDSGSSL